MKKLALMLILAGMATACSSMDKSDDMMMQDKVMTSDMDKNEMKSDDEMKMDSMAHDAMKKDSMMMDAM